MKPHEETWAVGRDGAVRKIDAEGPLIGWTHEQARLISAAPEMARALLEHVEACDACGGDGLASIRTPEGRNAVPCPTCEDDRLLLRKAGVLP